VGLSIVGGVTGNDAVTALAFVIFISCAAVQWHGTRLLTGAVGNIPLVLIGPLLIAAVNLLPVGANLPMARGIAAAILNLTYFIGALIVLLRPPGGSLAAYKPLAVLFVANIIAIGLGPFGGLGSAETGLPPLLSIGGFIYIEAQLFVIGTTIFVVAAVRERRELAHRSAADTDSLTGLANRRSFLERADRLAARGAADAAPLSVLVIDLDKFKSINDGHGHAAGDAVLRVFAQVARKVVRPNDVVGRLGGEEFAVLLSGTDAQAALIIAERIRRGFQQAAEFVDGVPVRATLSAGVASGSASIGVEMLIRAADGALYVAKQNGRNRVELVPSSLPPDSEQVVRVA
jgi:diguanylate cyclase (GGDEF)-like protein